jgi:hypothetical protein
MTGTRTLLAAIVALGALLPACTGSGSGTLNPSGTTLPPVTSAPVQAQPLDCPKRWKFSPVEGSDNAMVPGVPSAAVSCNPRFKRRVITGDQLATLVQVLNSRRVLDPKECVGNLGGLVLSPTQLYFNYPSGDIQVVNVDPNCRTATNGRVTAEFAMRERY